MGLDLNLLPVDPALSRPRCLTLASRQGHPLLLLLPVDLGLSLNLNLRSTA